MIVGRFGLHMRAESKEASRLESYADMLCFAYSNDATVVHVHLATSLISPEQAKVSLDAEVPITAKFDDVAARAQRVWHR
jgi:putative alpha-1,2-mannosidase